MPTTTWTQSSTDSKPLGELATRPGRRLRRLLAAAVLCLATVLTSVGLTATSASAVTNVTWSARCEAYYGALGRNLTVYLNQQPVGTRVEADLYKYVPSTGRWTYQNAYVYATVNGGGFWQYPGGLSGNVLQLTGWSAGSYALYLYQWNGRGTLLYQGWSNSCYFAS